jgi:hypothetical protein
MPVSAAVQFWRARASDVPLPLGHACRLSAPVEAWPLGNVQFGGLREGQLLHQKRGNFKQTTDTDDGRTIPLDLYAPSRHHGRCGEFLKHVTSPIRKSYLVYSVIPALCGCTLGHFHQSKPAQRPRATFTVRGRLTR